ncbi:MAG: mechanosensitive ion channel [Bacteroidia bacterium]|nr:mechanosensitive ion channel [Bacteroidia bacterium]
MQDFKTTTDQLVSILINYAPRIVSAIVILILGFWIIKLIVRKLRSVLVKGEMDSSWAPFFASATNVILYILLILSVASIIGIQTASFVAILGAIGLAIGLALQGSFSNFAGGVMILMFKPIKLGEYIESNGVAGKVNDIHLFNTTLQSYDNKIIMVPNGVLSNNVIINYSRAKTRFVEWTFGIGYDDSIEQVRKLIIEEIFTDDRVINKAKPFVSVADLASSSVNILVRAEVKQKDYWDVLYIGFERVKERFDKEGIHIPFPQQDIHIIEQVKAAKK